MWQTKPYLLGKTSVTRPIAYTFLGVDSPTMITASPTAKFENTFGVIVVEEDILSSNDPRKHLLNIALVAIFSFSTCRS